MQVQATVWMLAVGLLVSPLVAAAQNQDVPRAQIQGQRPDLERPTTKDDPVPLLDFEEYFAGTWTFEWTVPDSPFGPGGTITGTETYPPGIDGRFFESRIEAEGPTGPFTVESTILYDPTGKYIARQETDSRGVTMLKGGAVRGDLGGYYTILFESAPFEYDGSTLRLRTTTMLLSPLNFRVRAQLSVDGGPFVSFGNPWWRKKVEGM